MSEFKIERGITIPQSRRTGLTDVFRRIEVGDSVLIANRDGLNSIAHYVGIKITVRKEGDGVRVWRIK